MEPFVVRALVRRLTETQSFEGHEALLAQVPFVRVVGGPVTFLELEVDAAAVRPSAFLGGPVPGCAWVRSADGETIGTMIVWFERGYISALEYGWMTDEPPTELPAVEQILS